MVARHTLQKSAWMATTCYYMLLHAPHLAEVCLDGLHLGIVEGVRLELLEQLLARLERAARLLREAAQLGRDRVALALGRLDVGRDRAVPGRGRREGLGIAGRESGNGLLWLGVG